MLTCSRLGLLTSNEAVVLNDVRENGTVSCTCSSRIVLSTGLQSAEKWTLNERYWFSIIPRHSSRSRSPHDPKTC